MRLPIGWKYAKKIGIISIVVLCVALFLTLNLSAAGSSDLYFPPLKGAWEKVSPEQAEWNAAKLKKAMEYAGNQNSSGVVILYRGRILAEQYWKIESKASPAYQNLLIDTTSDGRAIEDVASVQKSVISFLAAIAREQGKLDLNRTVADYLGKGWSKATPKQEEKIAVRHLMAMTSGLNEALEYRHPAGNVWQYNTRAYSKMIPILTNITGMSIKQLTYKWLTAPTGMRESRWEPRPWVQNRYAADTTGFATSARDLARFGLLVLAEGRWGGQAVLKDSRFLRAALQPSQHLKPSYGLLWWLISPSWFPQAPGNAFAAMGRLSRIVCIVPSRQLVFTRLGDQANRNFLPDFWILLSAAMPD